MVNLILALLICQSSPFTQVSDQYQAARERMQAALRLIEQQAAERDKQIGEIFEPPKQPEPLTNSVQVEWSEEQSMASSGGQIYLVSEDWCRACSRMKANTKAAGVPFEEVTVAEALSLRLDDRIASLPRLVHSENKKDFLQGVWGVDSIRNWHKRQPQLAISDPITTATVHSQPSVSAVVAALTEHLVRGQDASNFPVGGLFDRDFSVPQQVPQVLSALMAGKSINVEEAGLTVSWTGSKRAVTFTSTENITLSPPVSVNLTKWGLSVSTTLTGLNVTDAGRTVRFVLKGPDFTVRFVE